MANEVLTPEIVTRNKVPATLDKVERGILRKCEQTIERNARGFVEMADALTTIRENRLYRETHSSFDAYCQDRWSFTRQRAQQLITAGETVRQLPAAVRPKIDSERKARAVKPVADDPAAAAAVVDAATDAAGVASAAAISSEVAKTRPAGDAEWEASARSLEFGLGAWVKSTDRSMAALLLSASPQELRACRSLLRGIIATIDVQLDDAAKAKRAAAARSVKGGTAARGKRQVEPILKGGKK